MSEQFFELSDVLQKLRHADDALTEFIAPYWPGVIQVAAWMEHEAQVFDIANTTHLAGYYIFSTDDNPASIVRPATEEEISRYLNLLPLAQVILLPDNMAFPATFAEKLQGITAPMLLHFAHGETLDRARARFDGVNLLYDGLKIDDRESPLAGLFSSSFIFSPGELLDVPGGEGSDEEAASRAEKLLANQDLASELALQSLVHAIGGEFVSFELRDDDLYHLRWRQHDVEHTVSLPLPCSPIVSGICLAGSRGYDQGRLTKLLLESLPRALSGD